MSKQASLLVVAPHPDDAEFGVAGTVARLTREGKEVVYVICTNGDKGTSDVNMKPEVLAKIREKEQLAAAKVLGVKKVVFLHYPDQGLEDTAEFRKNIVRQIRTYCPEVVATADPYRRYIWHRDHRITGQVTLDAIFPYARDVHAYPDLMAEGLKPHHVKEVLLWGSEDSNYCSDITETFDIKIAALRCHESQLGERFASGLTDFLRERAKAAAKHGNCELGESFHRIEIPW